MKPQKHCIVLCDINPSFYLWWSCWKATFGLRSPPSSSLQQADQRSYNGFRLLPSKPQYLSTLGPFPSTFLSSSLSQGTFVFFLLFSSSCFTHHASFLLIPSSCFLPLAPFLLLPSSYSLPPASLLMLPSSRFLPLASFLLLLLSGFLPLASFLLLPSSFYHPHASFLVLPSSCSLPLTPFLLLPSSYSLPLTLFLLLPSSYALPLAHFLLLPPSSACSFSSFLLLSPISYLPLTPALCSGPHCSFSRAFDPFNLAPCLFLLPDTLWIPWTGSARSSCLRGKSSSHLSVRLQPGSEEGVSHPAPCPYQGGGLIKPLQLPNTHALGDRIYRNWSFFYNFKKS